MDRLLLLCEPIIPPWMPWWSKAIEPDWMKPAVRSQRWFGHHHPEDLSVR
ncbi:MAG: hypothetical protein IPP47_19980 [Bryobacterales bacterium]|nr:hypothetical protein [Bryobacterales bacterium]